MSWTVEMLVLSNGRMPSPPGYRNICSRFLLLDLTMSLCMNPKLSQCKRLHQALINVAIG